MWGPTRVNKFGSVQKADLCHCLAARGPAIALSNMETRLGIQASIQDVLQALWGCDLKQRCPHDLSDCTLTELHRAWGTIEKHWRSRMQ
jgi:hypothetical protein